MQLLNTNNLKQYGLIALILLVGITLAIQLSTFIPGLLGAATLYILMRKYFFYLTIQKNWKKWVTATLFILASMILFVLPIFFLIQAVVPKFQTLLSSSGQLNDIITALTLQLQKLNLPVSVSSEQVFSLLQNASSSVPAVLGATMNFFTNTILAFFILYFMLVQGKEMEDTILDYLPLKEENIDHIWDSTRTMVNSNAIGIPVLAASQAFVAIIGYMIFGIKSYVLWGILTGVFSVVPILGCMVIWVPLCVYMAASGQMPQALGLAIYSFVITGGVDNVLRFTILKRLGDIHPITTTLGIIVGIPLFGFMGFIFGPLLVSYLLLLITIYRVEFAPGKREKRIKEQRQL